jgi:hypothetical protein
MKTLITVAANLLVVLGVAGLTATDNILVIGTAMAIGSFITTKLVWW